VSKREIKIDLDNLLDLALYAQTFGIVQQELLQGLAEFAQTISEAEIESFARDKYLSEEARENYYTEEDYLEAKTALLEWKENYFI
jgi:hypothetical protein